MREKHTTIQLELALERDKAKSAANFGLNTPVVTFSNICLSKFRVTTGTRFCFNKRCACITGSGWVFLFFTSTSDF